MTRNCSVLIVWVLALTALASPAAAQVLEPPPRPRGGLLGGGPPPDPKRTHQELTLRGSLLGGYDDNLIPPSGGDLVVPHDSGYIGFGDGTVRYWVGKDTRSMEFNGRGFANTYRNAGVRPSYGGEQNLRVRTTLGRRTQLEAAEVVSYAPYFSLGLFGNGNAEGNTGAQNPENNPTTSLTEGGAWTKGGSASLVRQLGRRTSMNVGYTFTSQTYVGGVGFDSRMHVGLFGLDRSVGRSAVIRATYQHSDSQFVQQDGTDLPLVNRSADLGFRYKRSLSRTRQIAVSGGAGMMRVDTADFLTRQPVQYWQPAGYGTLRFDAGRSWSLTGDYRRSITVLQGVAPEGFLTDAATISAGGLIQRWVEAVITAGYSNGVAGQRILAQTPSYDGYTGAVQFKIRLTDSWSSVVSLNHFEYRLNQAASLSLGVSPQMHRNGVRVGFTWLLPLYGSSVERAEPLSGLRN